jgi:MbtH protein
VSEAETPGEYVVVRNHEEQYSVWWSDRELPDGWEAVGASGTKDECLSYIEEVWTDLTPRSVRLWLEEQRAQAATGGRT